MSQSLEELQSKSRDARDIRQRFRRVNYDFFGGSYSIKQFLLQESDVGKTRDGGTSVTVKMGKTRTVQSVTYT